MILNCGKFLVRPEAIVNLKSALPEHAARCRKSLGCLGFTMTIEDEAAGEIAVWELWKDKASLDALLKEEFATSFLTSLTPSILSVDMRTYHVVAKAGETTA
jgi:quinol monooxygenase YgiN